MLFKDYSAEDQTLMLQTLRYADLMGGQIFPRTKAEEWAMDQLTELGYMAEVTDRYIHRCRITSEGIYALHQSDSYGDFKQETTS